MANKKTFLVDVHWDVAKTYEVEATSREEAQAIMEKEMEEGRLSYFDDGYESTDDTSIECVGVETTDGRYEYFN